MLRKGFKAWLPVACALALTSVGCGKAKEALEDALGVKKIEEDEVNKVKEEVNWANTVDENVWKLHSVGLRIADDAPFSLSDKEIEIPLPFDLPADGIDAAANSKGRILLLLKKRSFKVEGKDITRFQIVTAAKIDDGKLKISGEVLNQYLEDDQKLSKENQAGDYFLAEAKGTGGIALLQGKTQVKKNDGTVAAAPKTIVFTSSSPFMTESGSTTGMFMLAVPEGSTGTGVGYKSDIASLAPGAPKSTTTDITYTGLLDQYKDEFDSKTAALGSDLAAKGSEAFDKVNNAITTYLDAWAISQMDLVFVQPPKKPDNPPPPPPNDPDPPVPDDDKPVDPTPPNDDAPVSRGDETENIDLGCFGKHGDSPSLVYGYEGNENHKGWFAIGDVRISHEEHEKIFGNPETLQGSDPFASRYLDSYTGYCLLTTGDGGFQAAGGGADVSYLKPIDGKKSELWQKIKVPAADSGMKSIQIRVAFFSQEFPMFVGTQFNDSFAIKFDEATEFIAQGNLNDLAAKGGAAEVADCAKNKTIDATQGLQCGDWYSIAGKAAPTEGHKAKPANGTLFAIDKSTEAPPAKIAEYDVDMKCEANGASKCYHGWVPPRVICKDLKKDGLYDWYGQEMTLRISVTDAGDSYFDSAIAIDSIAFSDKACDEGSMIASDRASFVNQ